MTNEIENVKNAYIPSLKQELRSLETFTTANPDVVRLVRQRIQELTIELEFWNKQKL